MKTTDQRHIILLSLLLGLLAFVATVKAQLPSRPVPPRLVNDFTGTLSTSQANTLEHKLVAYNDSTSTQILVLIVNDLKGYSADQFAIEIGHSWGVGQKGKDNGVVILVKPKTELEKGRASINTGYGIEEYITDATAKRIVEKEMIPEFKKGDYYTGIDKAVDVIMDLCSGKFSQDEYDKGGIPLWLIIAFIIAIILIKKNNNQNYSGGGTRTIWIPMGGFGGGFGGSSGGFGGFGGGGFGGGGASGSW